MALDSYVADRLRAMLRLPDDADIPMPLRKVITDFQAEHLGEQLLSSMTDEQIKLFIQIAECRYPSKKSIPIKPGATVFSRTFNDDVIFVRPAAIERALINRGGTFVVVQIDDLVTNEDADPNSRHNQLAEKATLQEEGFLQAQKQAAAGPRPAIKRAAPELAGTPAG